MLKVSLKKTVAVLCTFVLVLSVFPTFFAFADEEDEKEPIVFEHLIGNDGVRRPSEAGALQLVEYNGQLTLAGEDGEPVQLRGMSTHGLHWFGEIVNENAFAALSNDWECNVIRLAMYVGEYGYATDPSVKELVYKGIELAFENDMYVIVDWHVHAPGDPRAEVYSGAYDFFEELADHYKDHEKAHYIIWELANEPSSNSSGGPGITNDEEGWQAVKEYAEPIVEMLREKGDNIIIVGSPNWSQRPDLAADDPIDAANIMYTIHFYTGTHMPADEGYPEGTPSSRRQNVMNNARYAMEKGFAVIATEWGVSEATGDGGPYLDEADVWIEFLNENNISWVNWSLTNKNEISGAFVPFELGKTEATSLDPGDDQVWAIEELSLSGEYIRSRIKGIEYEPIDRTIFTKVIWDFDDETTQGFVSNADSPIEVELSNEEKALKISGLDESNDISSANFWANARISADEWEEAVDILGGEEISFDIISDSPSTVSIAAVLQGPAADWANPARAIQVTEEDFEEFGDRYKATLVISTDDAPSFETIATDADDNTLTNIILFVGAESASTIYIDNITVTGTIVEIPIIHDELGEPALPSDFEDGTRQGWKWNPESGVKNALTIEEVNGSNAISWEFAYPDVKPEDGWASASRLEMWMPEMVRGDNDFVVFDLYIHPIRGEDQGSMLINLVFQPPEAGWWAQSTDVFEVDFTTLDEAEVTDEGLYHYEVQMSLRDILSIEDDMELRNIILIFAEGDYTLFAGRLYLDNIRFEEGNTVEVKECEGGTIEVSKSLARPGNIIDITVIPDEGMKLKEGSLKYTDGVEEVSISETSFVMPESDVTIFAEFVAATEAALTAKNIVMVGEEYKVTYELKDVGGIYAQDITLNFDEEVFDFVDAQPATDDTEIVETTLLEDGKLRVIAVNDGGISGNLEVINFIFNPKDMDSDAYTDISIIAELGTAPSGDVIKVEDSLESVRVAVADPADVNRDGVINVGDLAIVVYHNTKNIDSSDWEEARIADVNNDGVIDILDISYVASRIVE